MDITIDLKNYQCENSIFKRTAARGIIRQTSKDRSSEAFSANAEVKYLLIYSKKGDYKFPGGGLEKGEKLEETLVREIQEETGYQVIRSTIQKYGKVLERRKGDHEDVMEMESHYFVCEVAQEVGNRNLDEYEEEYDYQVVWMTLEEAIAKNKQIPAFDSCPWVLRDLRVMEILVGELL